MTHAAGATTAAPSIISIVLRAGWSLRGVENRYFRHEAAGDQYLGRILAGLDPTSGEFAILPPWFAATTQQDKKIVNGKDSILSHGILLQHTNTLQTLSNESSRGM